MADRIVQSETNEYDDRKRRKGGWSWLLLLIPLLLILLLAYYFLNNDKDDAANQYGMSDQSTTTNDKSANSADKTSFAELQGKYTAAFSTDARTVYFVADSTQFEDQAAANAKLDAIADFAKKNPQAKLQANGSIFASDKADSTSQLAKERAELVKKMLVDKGVPSDRVSTSTLDRYEGTDDAARAAYARSVMVTVVQ